MSELEELKERLLFLKEREKEIIDKKNIGIIKGIQKEIKKKIKELEG